MKGLRQTEEVAQGAGEDPNLLVKGEISRGLQRINNLVDSSFLLFSREYMSLVDTEEKRIARTIKGGVYPIRWLMSCAFETTNRNLRRGTHKASGCAARRMLPTAA